MTTHSDFLASYGPTALVTGASSGIGEAFARDLAARGFNLLLVARREQRLSALAEQLQAEHAVTVNICSADLAQSSDLDAVINTATAMDIGLVVSNAGFGLKGRLATADAEALDSMLAVNCRVAMQLSRALIPQLSARARSGLIFTSSVEALMGFPYSAAYAATKAFVNGLAESLWGELRDDGVDVLALCPSSTDTEALDLQGIDRAALDNMMTPAAVAAEALAALPDGPVYIAGEANQQTFAGLTAMDRREALLMMGETMRQAIADD